MSTIEEGEADKKARKAAKKAEKEARIAKAKVRAVEESKKPKPEKKDKEALKSAHVPRAKPSTAPAAAPPASSAVTGTPSVDGNSTNRAGGGAVSSAAPAVTGADKKAQVAQVPSSDPNAAKDSKKSTAAKVRQPVVMQYDDPKRRQNKHIIQRVPVKTPIPLFSHLPQNERMQTLSGLRPGADIHPSFLRLGLQFAHGTISGSNARCVAFLSAVKEFLADYRVPPNDAMSRDLEKKLNVLITFIIDCRPQSVSMGNAIRYLKGKITKLPSNIAEAQAKEYLYSCINSFIQERIELAAQIIQNSGASKINDGDVILTYAMSNVVELIIKKAHDSGKKFSVIVVDSRPKLEGRELLKRLVKHGVKCTYVMLNALAYVIKSVSKVYLGAHACWSNGSVMSRVGSAVVAMMAHTHSVPVLVCCETYKFNERALLDAICSNELGDPDDLSFVDEQVESKALANWKDPNSKIKLLNLTYDLTPAEFVNMVITEVGTIPPTSVPVILREYHITNNESK